MVYTAAYPAGTGCSKAVCTGGKDAGHGSACGAYGLCRTQMPQGGMGQPAAGSLQNQPAASEAAGSVAEPKPAETPDGTENGNLPSKEDYDRIWKAVFEDGEASKGSFYIIGSGAELTAVEEHFFYDHRFGRDT